MKSQGVYPRWGAGQVSSLAHSSGASVLEGFDITRNVLGSPTEVTTTTGGATSSALYSYDVVGRLRTECYPASGEVCTSKSPRMVYTYDKVGNRLTDAVRTVSGTRATTVVTDYAYDVADQLLTQSVGGAPGRPLHVAEVEPQRERLHLGDTPWRHKIVCPLAG